jgi:hypothetical protein
MSLSSARVWEFKLFFNRRIARIFHEFESFICMTYTLVFKIRGMIPLAGAFRGAVVLMLPQVPDNAVNGRFGLARRVKTFMLSCQNGLGTKCYQ